MHFLQKPIRIIAQYLLLLLVLTLFVEIFSFTQPKAANSALAFLAKMSWIIGFIQSASVLLIKHLSDIKPDSTFNDRAANKLRNKLHARKKVAVERMFAGVLFACLVNAPGLFGDPSAGQLSPHIVSIGIACGVLSMLCFVVLGLDFLTVLEADHALTKRNLQHARRKAALEKTAPKDSDNT